MHIPRNRYKWFPHTFLYKIVSICHKGYHMKKIICTAIILGATFSRAYAITTSGNASVIIKNAITATQSQSLNFGTVSSDATGGTVTVSPAGTVSSSTLSFYGTANAGKFNITAQPSTALNINISDSTVSNGSSTMDINNFVTTSTPTNYTTDSSGNLVLNVGADLKVLANQAPGTYNGTYTVTVGY